MASTNQTGTSKTQNAPERGTGGKRETAPCVSGPAVKMVSSLTKPYAPIHNNA